MYDAATVFETEHGHVPLAFLFPDWAAKKWEDGRAGVEGAGVGGGEEGMVGDGGGGKRSLVDIDDLLGGVLLWCYHVLLSCCYCVVR